MWQMKSFSPHKNHAALREVPGRNLSSHATALTGPILASKSEELCGISPVPANVFNFHPVNSWQGNAEGVLLSYCCLLFFSLTL